MNDDLQSLKQQMCDIGRRIWQRGYGSGNEGNHSIRLSEDRVLCTPSGVSKGFMDPATICTVDLDGTPVDVPPGAAITTEIRVHLALYRARADVRAVVHSHPPHAGAFALANIPLPEGLYPEAEVFLGQVPMVPYRLPGTDAVADAVVAQTTAETRALLLAHHGAVTLSTRSLEDAYLKLEIIDAYAKILLEMAKLRRVELLTESQMTEVLIAKRDHYGLADSRLVDGHAIYGAHNAAFYQALNLHPTDNPDGETLP